MVSTNKCKPQLPWKETSNLPESEEMILMIVGEKYIIGYFDYGVFREEDGYVVNPSHWLYLSKPTKTTCKKCCGKGYT